jgi:hypothetical protein
VEFNEEFYNSRRRGNNEKIFTHYVGGRLTN